MSPVMVVRERDGERLAPTVHWGFVRVWAKDRTKQRPQPINARIETVATALGALGTLVELSLASLRGILLSVLALSDVPNSRSTGPRC
ncbi:hypothetical protein C5D09_06870 [Rathayibacter sp. AY1C9]|nr:SOS response-associated peptidase family protein [Rathayibacter sp. AY1C1]PPH07149.1 hypothetical protein C5C71_15225 [Rathayibacter sp. AY1C1]PPH46667.1 hypothetical protein C5D09_06870 [Rathayibacter sp. AY1C9]